MRYLRLLLPILICFVSVDYGLSQAGLPQIWQDGGVKHLYVDGKPYIMLAGELHNSSASSHEYMKPIWKKLAATHLNTVIGTASWELTEPEEGRFDFSQVDAEIQDARQSGMRLVLIWFATWKNAGSSYVPHWVKADRKRFPVMVFKPQPVGERRMGMQGGLGSLSLLGENTLNADAKAFRALMQHIKEIDPDHTGGPRTDHYAGVAAKTILKRESGGYSAELAR
jgi:beta-galactosidase GanA